MFLAISTKDSSTICAQYKLAKAAYGQRNVLQHSLGIFLTVDNIMDQFKVSILIDYVHPYMQIILPRHDGIFHLDNVMPHEIGNIHE